MPLVRTEFWMVRHYIILTAPVKTWVQLVLTEFWVVQHHIILKAPIKTRMHLVLTEFWVVQQYLPRSITSKTPPLRDSAGKHQMCNSE